MNWPLQNTFQTRYRSIHFSITNAVFNRESGLAFGETSFELKNKKNKTKNSRVAEGAAAAATASLFVVNTQRLSQSDSPQFVAPETQAALLNLKKAQRFVVVVAKMCSTGRPQS